MTQREEIENIIVDTSLHPVDASMMIESLIKRSNIQARINELDDELPSIIGYDVLMTMPSIPSNISRRIEALQAQLKTLTTEEVGMSKVIDIKQEVCPPHEYKAVTYQVQEAVKYHYNYEDHLLTLLTHDRVKLFCVKCGTTIEPSTPEEK